jgi:hypothetical protein
MQLMCKIASNNKHVQLPVALADGPRQLATNKQTLYLNGQQLAALQGSGSQTVVQVAVDEEPNTAATVGLNGQLLQKAAGRQQPQTTKPSRQHGKAAAVDGGRTMGVNGQLLQKATGKHQPQTAKAS